LTVDVARIFGAHALFTRQIRWYGDGKNFSHATSTFEGSLQYIVPTRLFQLVSLGSDFI
jgi:hypothetical protein